MKIKIGPAGIGKVKEVEETFAKYKKAGIKHAEIPFTYGVYIKNKEDAEKVKAAAQKNGISLSIHAPYWINLNSEEVEKVEASKKRILDSLKVGTWIGASVVVFHPGYYSKNSQASFTKTQRKGEKLNKQTNQFDKTKTYEKIKNEILELQKLRKANHYTPKLAPETTGKVNVFGSIEEIAQLVRDTGCSFTIDFAHILAREKTYSFNKVFGAFKKEKHFHVHFSGIVYGEKGEQKHIATPKNEIKTLFKNLQKDKTYTIVNEAPDPFADAVNMIGILREKETRCSDKK